MDIVSEHKAGRDGPVMSKPFQRRGAFWLTQSPPYELALPRPGVFLDTRLEGCMDLFF